MAADDETVRAARSLVAGALATPLQDIPSDGSIHTIPAWDSLGHVRVLMALEAEIGRPLSSDAIAALASVADVAAALADNAAQR